jgi:hypothetical protein
LTTSDSRIILSKGLLLKLERDRVVLYGRVEMGVGGIGKGATSKLNAQ